MQERVLAPPLRSTGVMAAADRRELAQRADELQAALDGNARAAAAFATLNSANRWAFCFRVETSKRAETKQRHVERAIAMLERGETYH